MIPNSNPVGSIAPSKVVLIILRLCSVALFLLFLNVSAALAQNSYSDEWADDSNPNAGYIVGCGVTEEAYNGYGHEYTVETTLTSPTGRTASGSGSSSGYNVYARADVELPWDFNDLGEYIITSTHRIYCPIRNMELNPVETSTSGFAGSSLICYRYDHYNGSYINPYVYKIVEGCEDRISCYNTYFYSFYSVGMRGKSSQAYFVYPFTSIKQCLGIEAPLLPGACDVNFCQDYDIF